MVTNAKLAAMVTVQSRRFEHGAFLDMQLVEQHSLKRSPSISEPELMMHEWMRCVAFAETSYQVFADPRTPRDLLIQHFGKNVALDASLNCIIKALASMRRGKAQVEWIDVKLYGYATNCLRKALDDPIERYSTEILCTTLVLSKLEECFGTHGHLNHITHAGGIARMLEFRGSRSLDDTTLHSLLHACQGNVLSYCLARHQDSIFCQPGWQAIYDTCGTLHCGPESFMHRLYRHMVFWPTFAKEVAAFNRGECMADDLIMRLEATGSVLEELEAELNSHFQDQSWATETETESARSLTSTSYRFSGMAAAGAYSYHAMYCIALNTMLASLYTSPTSRAHSAGQNLFYSQRIWMSNEYAQSLRPLGCGFLITPLMMTYEAAADETMTGKLLHALDSLAAFKGNGRRFFSEAVVLFQVKVATGRLGQADLPSYQSLLFREKENERTKGTKTLDGDKR